MIDLGRLRALHAVAVHGSIGAAASALGYTPSAVSQQLAKLERETRTPLLERRGRGVVLTDAALMLADTAGQVLGLVEQAEVTLEAQRGTPIGQVSVAAFATVARGLLPLVLTDLAHRFPAMDVRLTEIDPLQAVDVVARGDVDLAVVQDWQNAPLTVPDGLSRAAIGEDTVDVLLPRGHPLAERDVLVPEELGDQRWICQQSGASCRDWLVRTLRAAHVEPDVAHEVVEYQTQTALISAGLGIGLLPRLGRGELPEDIVVRPMRPTPTRRLFALWRARASRRPAITVLVDALREHWDARDSADRV
ncbi:LysR family transcriptional regulator [Allokutzneria sp. NRRL B-24872]|uniref:LysR family transcriptional regulator n=1 Tax=Allokutzneria sp. NRRL B-24872 TaxID=1137961 RepID=UPI000A3B0E04|nr:LysR family transcriptional regulator [Allokutzneria sp. NRRL B-24872]